MCECVCLREREIVREGGEEERGIAQHLCASANTTLRQFLFPLTPTIFHGLASNVASARGKERAAQSVGESQRCGCLRCEQT